MTAPTRRHAGHRLPPGAWVGKRLETPIGPRPRGAVRRVIDWWDQDFLAEPMVRQSESGARPAPFGQQTAPNSSTGTRWKNSGFFRGSNIGPNNRSSKATSPFRPWLNSTSNRNSGKARAKTTRSTTWLLFTAANRPPPPPAPRRAVRCGGFCPRWSWAAPRGTRSRGGTCRARSAV